MVRIAKKIILTNVGVRCPSIFTNVNANHCRAPDTAPIKKKMVYAGSKDALTRALVGVSTKISATDLSELTVDILIEACRKFA
jgi:Cofilin/tropomyosin-type actin-binding protein